MCEERRGGGGGGRVSTNTQTQSSERKEQKKTKETKIDTSELLSGGRDSSSPASCSAAPASRLLPSASALPDGEMQERMMAKMKRLRV